MRSALALAAALTAFAACDRRSGSSGSAPKVAETGTAQGSAGGFSMQMATELAKAGIGDMPALPTSGGGTAPAAGSGVTSQPIDPTAGAGRASTGSGSTSGTTAATTDPGGSATATTSGAAGSASGATATAGSSGTGERGTTGAVASSDSTGTAMTATGAEKTTSTRPYVKPAPDIAAIKLDLEPNWERDMGTAGTFSLVVKVPSSDDTRVFSVRYGYEDAAAPVDCDQYRKFLEDRGAMRVTLNRQKGGACYIEGTDQAGVVAFRMMSTYGGKHLLCHGSLYKDPSSAALGDLRDKVLMQAKKICETLAL